MTYSFENHSVEFVSLEVKAVKELMNTDLVRMVFINLNKTFPEIEQHCHCRYCYQNNGKLLKHVSRYNQNLKITIS